MISKTTTELQNTRLKFSSPTRSPLNFDPTELILTTRDSNPLQCTLTLQLCVELYQQINAQALFNLNPQFNNSTAIASFVPELPLMLTMSLRPDLLPQLSDHQGNLADYFTELNTNQPDYPLFSTDNWFVLQVKQYTPSGEIGYRTFWDYVKPTLLFGEDVNSEAIADGLVEFFGGQKVTYRK